MATILFDSHTFIKRLKATGFTEEQAEVIVDASRDALSQLVTKNDLDQRLTALEQSMTIKFGALIAAAVGILIAVLRVPH
jgi:hypothetical protein